MILPALSPCLLLMTLLWACAAAQASATAERVWDWRADSTACQQVEWITVLASPSAESEVDRPTSTLASPLRDWTFLIEPPLWLTEGEQLLATVWFEDGQEGTLRLWWEHPASGQSGMVVEDLVQGSGILQRRTLTLPRALTRASGQWRVHLQQLGATAPVRGLRFEWVKPRRILSTHTPAWWALLRGDIALRVDQETDSALPAPSSFSQSSPLASPDQRVPLEPEIVALLPETPWQVLLAREREEQRLPLVRLRLEGAGWGVRDYLECFINGRFAGVLTLREPALSSGDYYRDPSGAWSLAGWREGGLILPDSVWTEGDQLLELRYFSPEETRAAPPAAVMRRVVLELSDVVPTPIPLLN